MVNRTREDKLLWLRSGRYILTLRTATFEAYYVMGFHIFTHLIHKINPWDRDYCPHCTEEEVSSRELTGEVPQETGARADSGRRAPEPVLSLHVTQITVPLPEVSGKEFGTAGEPIY